MLKVDIPNYLTKGGLWFGAMWFYNSFIESNGMSSKYTITDSLTFSVSNITALATIDILSSVLNFSYEGLSGMLAEPLFTGFLYMYLYNYFIN